MSEMLTEAAKSLTRFTRKTMLLKKTMKKVRHPSGGRCPWMPDHTESWCLTSCFLNPVSTSWCSFRVIMESFAGSPRHCTSRVPLHGNHHRHCHLHLGRIQSLPFRKGSPRLRTPSSVQFDLGCGSSFSSVNSTTSSSSRCTWAELSLVLVVLLSRTCRGTPMSAMRSTPRTLHCAVALRPRISNVLHS